MSQTALIYKFEKAGANKEKAAAYVSTLSEAAQTLLLQEPQALLREIIEQEWLN